jgi:hypothetical protein
MIRGGFLSDEDRKALIALARDGPAAGRVTRRSNALALGGTLEIMARFTEASVVLTNLWEGTQDRAATT